MKDLVLVDQLSTVYTKGGGLFQGPLVKTYAVEQVSLNIQPGQTLGLVGESGCGKSTLGKSILRLVKPSSGSVTVKDTHVSALNPRELRHFRRHMQMVFQDPYSSLNPRLRVSELVGEPVKIHEPDLSARDRMDKVTHMLEQVGLDRSALDRFPHQFSGGQRQRIGIARSMILHPTFVVCDEPVSALDVSIQSQIINLLRDLQQKLGLTYLFIAHDLRVVEYISDQVAVMYLGRIMEYASSKELYQHPLHPYTIALLSAVPEPVYGRKKSRIVLKGDVPTPQNPPSGCVFHTRCPIAETRCRHEVPKLVEFYPGHKVACHFVDQAQQLLKPQVSG